MKRQALIAQEAHVNYEREVVAHSATITSLSALKEEFSKVRDENASAMVYLKI
jgi:hypothetical protein